MTQVQLTPRLIDAVRLVWSYIAPDCQEHVEEYEGFDRADAIVELCLDADRLNPQLGLNDDIGAWADYTRLRDEHGYAAVRSALSQCPSLQF